MKFRTKLILSFAAVSAFLLVVVLGIGFWVDTRLTRSVGQNTETLLKSTADKLGRLVYAREEELSRMYERDPALSEAAALSAGSWQGVSGKERQAGVSEIDQHWQRKDPRSGNLVNAILRNAASRGLRRELQLHHGVEGRPVFGEIFVTDNLGLNVAMTNVTSDYRQDDEAWWQSANRDGSFVGDLKFDASAKIHAVEIAVRVERSGVAGVIKGVLDARELREELELLLEDFQYKTDVLEVYDAGGRRMFTSGRNIPPELLLPELRTAGYTIADRGGKSTLSAFSTLPSKGKFRSPSWRLVLSVDADEILAPGRALRFGAVTLFAMGIALALAVSILLARSLSGPLVTLTDTALRIGRGDLLTRVPITSGAEFRKLALGFEAMRRGLRRSHAALNAEVATRTAAELRYRLLFEGTDDMILTLDDRHNVIQANPAVRRHLGYPSGGAVGMSFLQMFRRESSSRIEQAVLTDTLRGLAVSGAVTRRMGMMKYASAEIVEFDVHMECIATTGETIIRARKSGVDPLRSYQTREHLRYRIPNDLVLIQPLIDRITSTPAHRFPDDQVFQLALGLRELITNAIEHGNLNITHDEKSKALEEGRYLQLVRQRLHNPEYRRRNVQITYDFTPSSVRYTIEDDGSGFDFQNALAVDIGVIDPGKLHGRGVAMTRIFFDSVEYTKPGNKVKVRKAAPGEVADGPREPPAEKAF